MHTVSFSVSSTIEKQLRANLSWAFARLQHYDAELLDAVAVAAHRCVYGEVGVLGMAMEMGRWRFLQAFLFWRMMMMTTTGYVSSSIFWRTSIIPTFWVETSPRDTAVDIARSRVVQHLVELRFVCGRPACWHRFRFLWNIGAKDWVLGLVVGSWKDSIFVLLHFHFQRFAGLCNHLGWWDVWKDVSSRGWLFDEV